MYEYVDNRQETGNLPDVEPMNTNDINCPCSLCPIMMIISLSLLIK